MRQRRPCCRSEVEQHQARIDLHDGWHDVDARPHTVQEMGSSDRSLDLVGEGVGIGGEKDVRHARMVHGGPRRPTFRGMQRGRVSVSRIGGYHAARA